MKYISKESSTRFENSKTCIVHEYNFDTNLIDTAHVQIQGRYPETGSVRNRVSTEVVYVISGEGRVCIDGKEQSLCVGDALCIHPQESFHFEGVMGLLVTCTPKWSHEQYEEVGV